MIECLNDSIEHPFLNYRPWRPRHSRDERSSYGQALPEGYLAIHAIQDRPKQNSSTKTGKVSQYTSISQDVLLKTIQPQPSTTKEAAQPRRPAPLPRTLRKRRSPNQSPGRHLTTRASLHGPDSPHNQHLHQLPLLLLQARGSQSAEPRGPNRRLGPVQQHSAHLRRRGRALREGHAHGYQAQRARPHGARGCAGGELWHGPESGVL